jgi:hypothetical protein
LCHTSMNMMQRIRDGTGGRERHLQTRLADRIYRRVRLGKRLLLEVVRGMEAFKSVFPVAHAPDGRSEIVGGEIGVALLRAPDFVDRLPYALPQFCALGERFRPVVVEIKISSCRTLAANVWIETFWAA